MKQFFLFLCALLVVVEATGSSGPQPGDSVAIVGGGVSGMFAARWLKKNGYHVTVFEAENELGASTRRVQYDGFGIDISTRYIPTASIIGDNSFLDIFTEYGLNLEPTLPIASVYLNPPSPTIPPISALPHNLLPFASDPQSFVGDLIGGLALLFQIESAGCRNPNDIIQAGFALPGESFTEWINRQNLPGFAAVAELSANTFFQGPTPEVSAAVGLNVRRLFDPSTIKQLLLAFGVTGNTTLPPPLAAFQPVFTAFMDAPFTASRYRVTEGYQSLLNNIASQDNINVKLNANVLRIKHRNFFNDVRITYRQGWRLRMQTFDHVIVTARPSAAKQLVRKINPVMSGLYQRAASFEPSLVWVFRGTSLLPMPTPNFAAYLFPQSFTFDRDGSVTAVLKQEATSDVFIALARSERFADPLDLEDKMMDDLLASGINVNEILELHRFEYTNDVSPAEVANGWFDQADAQQGVNNAYYIGELFFSASVPSNLMGVEDFLPKHFAV